MILCFNPRYKMYLPLEKLDRTTIQQMSVGLKKNKRKMNNDRRSVAGHTWCVILCTVQWNVLFHTLIDGPLC